MRHATVLVLNSTNTLSLAAALDPLRAANRQAGRLAFQWDIVTPGAFDVVLTSGITLPANPIARVTACDILIVVAGFNLEEQARPDILASLRRLAGKAEWVLAIDGGPWILAEAGLLDQHKATTHWEDLEKFQTRFPDVHTVNARYAVSGNRMTSGGAAPALDMMLALLAITLGDALATRVAGSFIYTAHPAASDPQLRALPRRPHGGITARAHQLMEAHIEEPLPLQDIAQRLGVSQRNLQLHFKKTLQTTAKSHYLSLRLAEAERLIRDTDQPFKDIALLTGFATQAEFSRACTRKHGMPPRAFRQQFRQSSAP